MHRIFAKLSYFLAMIVLSVTLERADGGVVVLQNRTALKIEYLLQTGEGSEKTEVKHSLTSTDIDSIRTSGQVLVTFHNGEEIKQFAVLPNAIYFFTLADNHLQLIHVGLPGIDVPDINTGRLGDPTAATPPQRGLSPSGVVPAATGARGGAASAAPQTSIFKVPVVILADGSETRVQAVWEKKIRARFEAASDIFEHHCGLRFEVVDARTWDADPKAASFNKALEDFERKIRPAPARLAVGFTGRFQWQPGEVHLGGTHGALMSHILIREALTNVSESEHLEVLVHELGHFLSAVHSADPLSVMRPRLGDRQSRAKSFRIGFDAANTLAMSLLVEEMSRRPVWAIGMLPPTSKAAMRGAYTLLEEGIPKDPPAVEAIAMLGPPLEKPVPADAFPPPLVKGVNHVLADIVRAAEENHKLASFSSGLTDDARRDGDKLTDFYVRRAAISAGQLPPEIGPNAFVVALGIGLDDMTLVRGIPVLWALERQVETPQQMLARLKVLDKPGIAGRNELARHFFVTAALTTLTNPQNAETVMVWKELSLAHNGGTFSFAEYDADLAGCVFAAVLHDHKASLATMAESFRIGQYIRDPQFLREYIKYPAFVTEFGSPADERFQRQRAEFARQIILLPVYQGR